MADRFCVDPSRTALGALVDDIYPPVPSNSVWFATPLTGYTTRCSLASASSSAARFSWPASSRAHFSCEITPTEGEPMTTSPNKKVLISGASIAGPVLAYWLHQYGFHVTVVEKATAV